MDRVRYRLNLPRLTEILGASRVSQNHWSIKLGFSRGHWSDIVNGRHPYPSEKTRLRMNEVFGVSDLFIAEQSERNADVDFRIAISGRYELTGEIGHGGMGTVYTAHDLSLARLVAIKVVSPEAASGIGPDQLLKEIAVVARLQHPNILPLFDAGTGAGSPFYVMPYVRTGSLGARLRAQGRLPISEVTGLVCEMAAGFAHAHSHRVLHCDIKPENILVDGAHAYIMDFGIARKLHTEANEWIGIRNELDFSAGTPAYVSPEQAAGDRDIDERSDVYSLACMTYEMLSGRAPFAGDNTQEVVSLRFREPPPPLQEFAPELPIAVVRAIERATSLDPGRRPRGAAEFAEELREAAASASDFTTKISLATSRTHRWMRTQMNKPDRAIRTGLIGRVADGIAKDIAFAWRQRTRSPGLTAMAVLTLAIAIGLATTVFALVEGVMLRPLPFPHQERLVALESVDSSGQNIEYVSSANWHDWKAGTTTLTGSAIYMSGRVSVIANEAAMRVASGFVSPEFFAVVGSRFLFGRGFDSAEVAARSGGAVVSEDFWRRELGAARDTGLAIRVNGYRMPVVGVLARGQGYPADAEVWTAYTHRQVGGGTRNNINWQAIGRLKEGVSIEDAQRELTAVARRIDRDDPGSLYSKGVHVQRVRDQLTGGVASLLLLLSGAVGVVLLIACANLASANLAQGARRQREMAVRSALGAGRQRLVRQVLIENIGIALAGATIGVVFAWGALKAAVITQGAQLPHITTIGINTTVLAIALAAAITTGIATGVLPALQASRAAPNDVLGGSARGTVQGSRGMAGRVLVGVEIALALVLVTGAGLFARSFRTVISKPLGFDVANVSYAEIALGGPKYQRDTALIPDYWTRLAQALRDAPGIRAASVTNFVPLVRGGSGFVEIEGKDLPGAGAGYRAVGEGYFDALGMTRYSGRDFSAMDTPTSERVALVNKAMADEYWDGDPIGKRVRASSMEPGLNGQQSAWITVIGVVSNVRHFGYEREPRAEMFVLYRQLPAWRLTNMSVVARGSSGTQLDATMRAAITAADASVPADISSLDAAAKRTTASRRFTMQVLSLFGVLALLLAGIGVYGILSFSVAQRTREIAVRSALGADREKLLGLVFGSAGVVIAAGIGAGLAGVYAGGRLIESMLFEVKASDPLVVAVAVVVIGLAGALAAAIPARRAVRIDPMEVLRNDG